MTDSNTTATTTIVWLTGFYHGVPLQFHSHIKIWSFLKKKKENKIVSAKEVEKTDSTPMCDILVAMSTS